MLILVTVEVEDLHRDMRQQVQVEWLSLIALLVVMGKDLSIPQHIRAEQAQTREGPAEAVVLGFILAAQGVPAKRLQSLGRVSLMVLAALLVLAREPQIPERAAAAAQVALVQPAALAL
jgi:hypothetical protein